MNTDLWSKRKKAIVICGVILGIILIIFLWSYYFTNKAYFQIYGRIQPYSDINDRSIYSATDIVYYGPDIDNYKYEEGEESYVNEGTNGIICIYTLHSRFDEWRGGDQDKLLNIVGNVSKIIHIRTGNEWHGSGGGYYDQIDKTYYLNWEDYSY